LINNDVPQEVVRKILDHSSWEMTAHYARLHDDTVRRHWERARKVDIHGNSVTINEDSPLADAQWAKQHLARATMALPNGYCGLPLQQNCPARQRMPDLSRIHHHARVFATASRTTRIDPRHH
jgi:hypothetical protein